MSKILFSFFYISILFCFSVSFSGCKADEDEYITERIDVGNDCFYHVIHEFNCFEYKPIIPNKEKIINLVKLKCDVYCPACISENEAIFLNAINKRNVEKMNKSFDEELLVRDIPLEEMDKDIKHLKLYDTSDRTFELEYILNNTTLKMIPCTFEDLSKNNK